MAAQSTRGILAPAEARFELRRHAPSDELAPFVDGYWIVRWEIAGAAAHPQETLPYPCVNLVFGTHQPGLHGVCRRRFVAELRGTGWALGVKFRPGTFRGFLGADVSSITDRVLPVGQAFGPGGEALARAVGGARDDEARVARLEAFLRALRPGLAGEAAEACRAVGRAQADPALTRADELARQAGTSLRRLQRLFRAHVGASPKWVIRRFRMQEALERVKSGGPVDWAALAQELGYFDQAHFIRDFRAQVGRTPREYAALCAAGAVGRERASVAGPT